MGCRTMEGSQTIGKLSVFTTPVGWLYGPRLWEYNDCEPK